MLRVNFCDSRLLYCRVEDSIFGTIGSVREPSTVGWQTLVWSIAKWLEILPRLGSSWLRPERWTPTSHEPRNRFTFLHRPFSATTVHRCLHGSASLWAAICQCQNRQSSVASFCQPPSTDRPTTFLSQRVRSPDIFCCRFDGLGRAHSMTTYRTAQFRHCQGSTEDIPVRRVSEHFTH